MKRRLFRSSIVAAISAGILLGLLGPAFAYSNDFESDTTGWETFAGNTITQVADGYANPAYADQIDSAGGTNHARLGRGTCTEASSAGGQFVNCYGPYTYWGDGNNNVWNGPYSTQVDIYLDTDYANANPDTYGGNYTDLTTPDPSSDPVDKGTRFDFTSAINSSAPLDANGDAQHLRDFGFNVSTGYAGDNCNGFMITGQTVVFRNNANPNIGGHDPQCIDITGWYTFKHSFSEVGGYLNVLMEVIPVGFQAPTRTWTITGIDPIETVGCNRYGWFANQEIFGLPIDNAKIEGGCDPTPPTPHVGVIAPTATTCQMYRDDQTTALEQLLYTTKGSKINAVSPGVFFYYTKVSGTKGQTVDITEDHGAGPIIPINQGQVVLYDALTCKVVKGWTPTVGTDGTATEPLPTDGSFIIGVKYNPSALKGKNVPSPTTVEYTFGAELNDVVIDEATIDLAPKA